MIAYVIFKERDLIVEWNYVSTRLFKEAVYLIADAEVNGQTVGLSTVETAKTKVVYNEQEIEDWCDAFIIAKLANNYIDDHNTYRHYSGMNTRIFDVE